MAQWYYAHDQKQSGPVTWDKLRELASSGVLEKSDMVWRDGLPEWQKAAAIEGLFARSSASVAAGVPAGASSAVSTSRRADSTERLSAERSAAGRSDAGRSSAERRRDPERDRESDRDRGRDDRDADDDPSPRRRKKKKKDEGMSPGAMAGLIGGCIAGGLVIVIIVIVLLVRTGNRSAPPPPALAVNNAGGGGAGGVQPQSYEVKLGEGQENMRAFQFQQGQHVTINVNTRGGFIERPDVDLYVSRAGDAGFLVFDDSLSEHCFVNFIAPATDQYTFRVDNLGPGTATCTVSIR